MNMNINLTIIKKEFKEFCEFYLKDNGEEIANAADILNKKIKNLIKGDQFFPGGEAVKVFKIQNKLIEKIASLSVNDSLFCNLLERLYLIRNEHLSKLVMNGISYDQGGFALHDDVAKLMEVEDVLKMLRIGKPVSINLSNFTQLNGEDIKAIKTEFPHLLLIGSHEDRFSDLKLVIPGRREIFYANSEMLENLSFKELVPVEGKKKVWKFPIDRLSGIPADIVKIALTFPCCGKITFDISTFEDLLKCADFFGNQELLNLIEFKLIKNLNKINIANFYFKLRHLVEEYNLYRLEKKLDAKLSSKFLTADYCLKSIYNTQAAKDAFGYVKCLTVEAKKKWFPSISHFNYLCLFAKSLEAVKFKKLKYLAQHLDVVLHWLKQNTNSSIKEIVICDFDPCIHKILETISSNDNLQIRSLKFKGVNVDSKFLTEVCKFPNLQELKIHGLWNTKFESWPNGLKKLDLSDSAIDSSLFRNYVWPPELTYLNLSGINIPEDILNSMLVPEKCTMIIKTQP